MKLYYTLSPDWTESMRMGSGIHPLGYGCNAQTFPKPLRVSYVPPLGYIFLQCDLSQAEARIVAWLARCQKQKDLFNDPTRHFHMENAKAIFGREVAKGSLDYAVAKAAGHAANYREGYRTFAKQTGLKASKAKAVLEGYHAAYPEIRQWHKATKKQLLIDGELVNPFGYHRAFLEGIGSAIVLGDIADTVWKDAIAWIPQSTIPIAINEAAKRIKLCHPEIILHLQVHDSLLISIPDSSPSKLVDSIVRIISSVPISIQGETLHIPSEAELGYSWGMMQEYTGYVPSREEWTGWCEEQTNKGKGLNGEYMLQQIMKFDDEDMTLLHGTGSEATSGVLHGRKG